MSNKLLDPNDFPSYMYDSVISTNKIKKQLVNINKSSKISSNNENNYNYVNLNGENFNYMQFSSYGNRSQNILDK